jgi:hypothetical protein
MNTITTKDGTTICGRASPRTACDRDHPYWSGRTFHGGSVEYFRDAVFHYPTRAEAYKVAASDGLNEL